MPTLDTSYGGTTVTAINLGCAQEKMGNEVTFIATKNKFYKNTKIPSEKCKKLVFNTNWPHGWFFSKEFAIGLIKNIHKYDIIEIHGVWQFTTIAAAYIARLFDVPFIIRPTGVFMHKWRYKSLKKRLYSFFLANKIIQNSGCIHVASKKEADGCRKAGFSAPIAIVANGVDINDYINLPKKNEVEKKWPILKNKVIILFLSLISPVKGLDQCLLAIKDIIHSNKSKNVLFVIAGPDHNGYRYTIELQIEKYGLDKNVFFTGMVKGREKVSLYTRADIFILPSYSENFGLVVAEALASGTPVVTTNKTPWEIIEKIGAGIIVSPNKKQISFALTKMLSKSVEERSYMGRIGRQYILDNFTWEIAGEKMIKVYRAIIDKNSIPLYP